MGATPVLALVAAAYANVYLTQPVLPVLAAEFGVDAATASLTVSLTVLGIALATLPFGRLADRYPLRPLILAGAALVVLAGLVCAATGSFAVLAAARLAQGLAIPALTTCVAAWLANRLPAERLNVAMGAYVSATVVGVLGGRLLGGFLHPLLHWRSAFLVAAALLAVASLAAARGLPGVAARPPRTGYQVGYRDLIACPAIVRLYAVPFGAFWVFSATFNYLPFHLGAPPFSASTGLITALYALYLVGVPAAPLAGRLAGRIGAGPAMVLGTLLFGLSLVGLTADSLAGVALALLGSCAGFFTAHSAATGALNARLAEGRGHGNALYVLAYYLGSAAGITASGLAWQQGGWPAVLGLNAAVLALPLAVGLAEWRSARRPGPA